MTSTHENLDEEGREVPEEDKMFHGAASLLAYAQEHQFATDVEEIIARVIETVSPTERLKELAERLTAYFDRDEEVAHALLLVIGFPEDESVVPLSEVASEEDAKPLRAAARRISGLFGADIARAFGASQYEPNNWANLDLRYSYLPSVDLWQAELEILKFDETRASLDGPAESFLRMINYLLSELTRMPAEAEAFAGELEDFRNAAKGFLDQYE